VRTIYYRVPDQEVHKRLNIFVSVELKDRTKAHSILVALQAAHVRRFTFRDKSQMLSEVACRGKVDAIAKVKILVLDHQHVIQADVAVMDSVQHRNWSALAEA
jgi:hypothetical protein